MVVDSLQNKKNNPAGNASIHRQLGLYDIHIYISIILHKNSLSIPSCVGKSPSQSTNLSPFIVSNRVGMATSFAAKEHSRSKTHAGLAKPAGFGADGWVYGKSPKSECKMDDTRPGQHTKNYGTYWKDPQSLTSQSTISMGYFQYLYILNYQRVFLRVAPWRNGNLHVTMVPATDPTETETTRWYFGPKI